jgi:hypothetical protein
MHAPPPMHQVPFVGGPYHGTTPDLPALPASALQEGLRTALEPPDADEDDTGLPDETWHVYELACPDRRWRWEYRGTVDEQTAAGFKRQLLERHLNN